MLAPQATWSRCSVMQKAVCFCLSHPKNRKPKLKMNTFIVFWFRFSCYQITHWNKNVKFEKCFTSISVEKTIKNFFTSITKIK